MKPYKTLGALALALFGAGCAGDGQKNDASDESLKDFLSRPVAMAPGAPAGGSGDGDDPDFWEKFKARLQLNAGRLGNVEDNDYQGSGNAGIIGEWDGFGFGYDALGITDNGFDDRKGEAFGLRVPLDKLSPLDGELYVNSFRDRTGNEIDQEYELIGVVRPFENKSIQMFARLIDLENDGAAVCASYIKDPKFSSTDNYGIAVTATRWRDNPEYGNKGDIGGNAWTLIPGGFFAGIGKYSSNSGVVVSMPGTDRFAFRFGAFDCEDGANSQELIVATNGKVLSCADSCGFLSGEAGPTNTFTRDGGMFRFRPPAYMHRGGPSDNVEFSGGAKLIEDKNGVHSAHGEAGIYPGLGGFNFGLSYKDPDLDKGSNCSIGLPIGYQFKGGDCFTRNYLRVEPRYNTATNSMELWLRIEYIF